MPRDYTKWALQQALGWQEFEDVWTAFLASQDGFGRRSQRLLGYSFVCFCLRWGRTAGTFFFGHWRATTDREEHSMLDSAGPLSNEAFRELPSDTTTRCDDNEQPSGRKIGGLFGVLLHSPQ